MDEPGKLFTVKIRTVRANRQNTRIVDELDLVVRIRDHDLLNMGWNTYAGEVYFKTHMQWDNGLVVFKRWYPQKVAVLEGFEQPNIVQLDKGVHVVSSDGQGRKSAQLRLFVGPDGWTALPTTDVDAEHINGGFRIFLPKHKIKYIAAKRAVA